MKELNLLIIKNIKYWFKIVKKISWHFYDTGVALPAVSPNYVLTSRNVLVTYLQGLWANFMEHDTELVHLRIFYVSKIQKHI